MAKSKAQQNSIALDPNRERLSINMSVTPGDPTTQMNNPMNVTSYGPQLSALPNAQGKVVNQFPYGDKGLEMAPQLGANVIDPARVERSSVPTANPVAGRGFQKGLPYGLTPPIAPAELMEAARINMHPSMQGKPQSPLGMTGQPAMLGTPPGFNAGHGTPLMTMAQYEGAAMTPGATKTTIRKNKGSKK